jgi:hypothetical protein
MDDARVPGFTAEASLYDAERRYLAAALISGENALIVPAVRCTETGNLTICTAGEFACWWRGDSFQGCTG